MQTMPLVHSLRWAAILGALCLGLGACGGSDDDDDGPAAPDAGPSVADAGTVDAGPSEFDAGTGDPCGDVPETGACAEDGMTLVYCDSSTKKLVTLYCPRKPGYHCGMDADGAFDCVEESVVASCGDIPSTGRCSESGERVESCRVDPSDGRSYYRTVDCALTAEACGINGNELLGGKEGVDTDTYGCVSAGAECLSRDVRCVGSELWTCDDWNNLYSRIDCADYGMVCGHVDGDSEAVDCVPPSSVHGDCGGVDVAGYCDGNGVATWCEAGELARMDCAGQGGTCLDPADGEVEEADCAYASCTPGSAPYCDGDVLWSCNGAGSLKKEDCGAMGYACGEVEGQGSMGCVQPIDCATMEDYEAVCVGERLWFCLDGYAMDYDCRHDHGMTCGQVSKGGMDCLYDADKLQRGK